MVKIIVFVVVSAGILRYSWPSLRNRQSHGFYRFFAFVSILLLFLLNVDYWINNPLASFQIVSWVLLCVSLFLAIHGFYLLRVVGQPEGDFENTTNLVTTGAYRYIRHPLYSSLLFLAWGIFFKQVTWVTLLLVLVVTISLVATARVEERENVARFGAEYAAYMKSTHRFIPFLF
ncbi:MAG: isoprenylcysteine carboxylmethyltransferase family protein [Anaerolineae bacterium]|nr:isoprenylcysteine carboxylmethyltransferase family protein [Anaerolineae bacterium]